MDEKSFTSQERKNKKWSQYAFIHFCTPRINYQSNSTKLTPHITFEHQESLSLLFGKKYKLTGHKIFSSFFAFTCTQHQPTPTYIFTYAKKEYQSNTFFTYWKETIPIRVNYQSNPTKLTPHILVWRITSSLFATNTN
jgi:hypothetical protein